MCTQTIKTSIQKVSAEILRNAAFSVFKYIEDCHDEPGICAIGQYDSYGDTETNSDSESDLFSMFWTNDTQIKVFVTADGQESEENVLKKFDEINKHLRRIDYKKGLNGLDFIRDKYTLKITYTV